MRRDSLLESLKCESCFWARFSRAGKKSNGGCSTGKLHESHLDIAYLAEIGILDFQEKSLDDLINETRKVSRPKGIRVGSTKAAANKSSKGGGKGVSGKSGAKPARRAPIDLGIKGKKISKPSRDARGPAWPGVLVSHADLFTLNIIIILRSIVIYKNPKVHAEYGVAYLCRRVVHGVSCRHLDSCHHPVCSRPVCSRPVPFLGAKFPTPPVGAGLIPLPGKSASSSETQTAFPSGLMICTPLTRAALPRGLPRPPRSAPRCKSTLSAVPAYLSPTL